MDTCKHKFFLKETISTLAYAYEKYECFYCNEPKLIPIWEDEN